MVRITKSKSTMIAVLFVTMLMLSSLATSQYVVTVKAQGYTEYTGTLGGAHYVVRFPDSWNGILIVICRLWLGTPQVDARNSLYNLTSNALLPQGYAVAASVYSKQGYAVKTAMNDTYQLTKFLIDNYHITGKVFLIGGLQYGGNVALMLGEKYPDVYSGVLDCSGGKDLKSLYETNARLANLSDAELTAELTALTAPVPPFQFPNFQILRNYYYRIAQDIAAETGGVPSNMSQAYEDISPTYHANITIPVITVQGTSDALNPLWQTLMYQDAVAQTGRSSLYRLYTVTGGQQGNPSVAAQAPSLLAELVAWSDQLHPSLRASAFSSVTVMPGWTWWFFAHSNGGIGKHTYQWYEGSTLLQGQTSMVMPATKTAPGIYTYFCKVTDAEGKITYSNNVTLTVLG